MTKRKAPAVQAAPVTKERPAGGGSFVRQKDGSLLRVSPDPEEAPADPAQGETPVDGVTTETEGQEA